MDARDQRLHQGETQNVSDAGHLPPPARESRVGAREFHDSAQRLVQGASRSNASSSARTSAACVSMAILWSSSETLRSRPAAFRSRATARVVDDELPHGSRGPRRKNAGDPEWRAANVRRALGRPHEPARSSGASRLGQPLVNAQAAAAHHKQAATADRRRHAQNFALTHRGR
jgi:hypothetical protein